MYKLVYIKGISRYDTWKFVSKQEQYNYFDNLDGVVINDYYPPHYTNTIKLEISQVDFNAVNYNYLLLSFNNKYYCYFIDNITYINEDIYSISITMDTIQTYMFDMNFLQSIVTKASIDRYIKNTSNNIYEINRDYIRENISKGDFIFNSQVLSESDRRYIIIYTTEDLNERSAVLNQTTQIFNNFEQGKLNITTNNCYVYILPLISTSIYDTYKDYQVAFGSEDYNSGPEDDTHYEYTNYTLSGIYSVLLDHFSSKTSVINMIVCNYEFIDGMFNISYTTTTRNNLDYIKFYTNKLSLEVGTVSSVKRYYGFRLPSDFRNGKYENSINIPLEVNHSLNVLKNKKFIPQLLDENYMRVYFGEKSNFTQIPLYQRKEYGVLNPLNPQTNISLRIISFFDILQCYRNYWYNNTLASTDDNLLTLIVCNTDESMALKNDAWKTYLSQNKATWTQGFQLQKDMAVMKFGVNLATSGIGALGSVVGGSIVSNLMGPKSGAMHEARAYSSAGADMSTSLVGGLSNLFMSLYNADANHRIIKENLLATPQESKQGNNFSNDFNINATDFISRIEVVSDIDKVANDYENEGYSLNKISYSNLFEYSNRYYYNIIQAQDVRFDLSVLATNDIKMDIRARFEIGLRLWNKSHNTNMLDNLIYDNVEVSLLEE